MANEEMRLDDEFVMRTFARKQVEFVEGRGMHLRDAEGKEYLDFLAGIGVCSLGHCHPVVVDALTKQASKLIHVSNYFYIENRGELARKISELLNAGAKGEDEARFKTFFANTGAEANECAIKLCRRYAKKRFESLGKNPADAPEIIVAMRNSFHGRTLATLAATGQDRFHIGFEPLPQGYVFVDLNDVEGLKRVMRENSGQVCAVMLEPIQGESGIHPCSPEFMRAVREECDRNDALMILDEVQCGIFRSGRPFAFQHFGVVPDIVTMAKGIASGMVMGACAAKEDVASAFGPGDHGTTFGGSNLAVSCALATLSELDAGGYASNAIEVGAAIEAVLKAMPQVTEVRGIGLMLCADLKEGTSAPDVVSAALEGGLVLNATGPSTLRFLPPLICANDDVSEFAQKLESAIS